MKRTSKTVYQSDSGRELLTMLDGKGVVTVCSVTADELDELATACSAAAEELRACEVSKETMVAE